MNPRQAKDAAGDGRSQTPYRRLLGYARPYWLRLAIGTACGLLFAGSSTGLLIALKKTLAHVFDSASSLEKTLLIAASLPIIAALRGLGYYLSVYFIEWVGNRVVMDLRNAAFARLMELPLGYFSRSRIGDLLSRISNDTMLVERAVSTVLGDLVRQPFVVIGMVGFLIWLDVRLAVISLVLFPVCLVPVMLFGRRVRRFSREGQEKLADMLSIVQEAVSGIRVVKAFGREDYERARFEDRTRAVFSRLMRVTRARAAVEPIIVVISVIGLALVLVYSRWSHMTADEFFSFAIGLVGLYDPVKRLGRVNMTIQRSTAAAARVFEILDREPEVRELPGAVVLRPPVRTIVFENVSFAYDDEPVLNDINLEVAAGQCLAIVGSSGCGKSTLVNLLPRFYDVTSGAVRINGRDIRNYTLRSLRNAMGIVTQETILFNDTVAANIAYGRPQATRSEIETAARRAHAHEFITALPQGYDTIIGERGVRLSGGECQRLAIARAMLRNPPVLILDEATSALDTEAERQVQAALNDLMKERTVFAIAHRLSTIARADHIIVLDSGRIVERGTHEELLARGGLYRRLYDLQFEDPSGTEEAAGAVPQ